METLYEYIKKSNTYDDKEWDGHIHLFNHKKPLPQLIDKFEKRVGFMDIEYNDINNINVLDSYKNYIKNHWDKDKEILLATGITIEDIKDVYNKYPKIIKGFGELKCYDEYGELKNLPYKKIKFVRDVVEFSKKNGALPVYIHWEFTNPKDVEKFENVLKNYPSVPIVLCHMGMNEYNRDFAYTESNRLQHIYTNLWLDISWDAADYFTNNPMLLNNFILDRVILGTDLNNMIFNKDSTHKDRDWNWGINKFIDLRKYISISNKSNIMKLFKEI